jgi:hypothetical protein
MQRGIAGLDRVQKVRQHREVGGDLVGVEPALRKVSLLEERRIDDVGQVSDLAELGAAGRSIGQVDADMARARRRTWRRARQRDHIEITLAEEVVDHGASDQAARARDQHCAFDCHWRLQKTARRRIL